MRLELRRPLSRELTRPQKGSGDLTVSTEKATGETLGLVATATPDEVTYALIRAREAHEYLRHIPAPRRGEVMRQIRVALADKLDDLGALVSLEMGKNLPVRPRQLSDHCTRTVRIVRK